MESSTAPAAGASPRLIPQVKVKFYEPVARLLAKLGDAFEQQGDVLQVRGFPFRIFCFRNPEHIAQIFKHRAVGLTKFLGVLPRVKWVMGRGAYILAGGEEWMRKRREVQPAFTGAAVTANTDALPPLVESLLGRWEGFADTGEAVDVYAELQRLIARVNFQTFFSADPGDSLPDIVAQTHFVEKSFVGLAPLWLPLPSVLRFKRDARAVRAAMLGLVRRRQADPAAHDDVLGLLLRLQREQAPGRWSDEEIVDEMLSIYFGASVMSVTLTWLFLLLAQHPAAAERLRAEAKALLQGRAPSAADLARLRYPHMVFQEATRLYPPSWGFPRYAEEDLEIDGYRIPAKSLVIPMIYHTQRHAALWPDPERFDPERFDPERVADIHPYALFPFGGGPRKCLGANLAPRVIELIAVMVWQRYNLQFRPRFAGDPVLEFGFEIMPRDKVLMSVHRV
jgi:cytochrome P450